MSQTRGSAEYSEVIPTRPGHYVYRCWADDVCLYVGLSGERGPKKVKTRFYAHKAEKAWWPQVTKIDVATFANAAEIIDEEKRQIATLAPVHNKALRGQCANGHDLTAPNSQNSNGNCVKCQADRWREPGYGQTPGYKKRQRKYRQTPAGKERARANQARYKMRLRGPAPGQQGLW